MDSGSMHHFVGADSSCISWGHAQYGELGFGPTGQKYVFITFDNNIFLRIPYFLFKFCLFLFLLLRSSATPKKVDILEGMHVIRWVFIYIFIIFIYLLCFYYNCTYRMWQWIFFFFNPFLSNSVACGSGLSMVIVDRTNAGDRLDQVSIQSNFTIMYWNFKVLFVFMVLLQMYVLIVMHVHSSTVQPQYL